MNILLFFHSTPLFLFWEAMSECHRHNLLSVACTHQCELTSSNSCFLLAAFLTCLSIPKWWNSKKGDFFVVVYWAWIKAVNSYLQTKKAIQMWRFFAGNVDNVKWQRNNMSNQAELKWHTPGREQLCMFSLHRLGPCFTVRPDFSCLTPLGHILPWEQKPLTSHSQAFEDYPEQLFHNSTTDSCP